MDIDTLMPWPPTQAPILISSPHWQKGMLILIKQHLNNKIRVKFQWHVDPYSQSPPISHIYRKILALLGNTAIRLLLAIGIHKY